MKKGEMTPEHRAKIVAARNKYWAERKAFPPKGEKGTDISVLKAEVKHIANNARGNHRDYVTATIANKRKKLIEAQLDVAIGYSYVTEDGKKIYTKPPNASTGEYLLNQLIGKPKESIDIREEIRLSVDI